MDTIKSRANPATKHSSNSVEKLMPKPNQQQFISMFNLKINENPFIKIELL